MSPPFSRVLVVLNPKAGTAADVGDDVGARVRNAFRERGVEAEVRAPEPAGLGEALSERATEGFDAVVAAGGDGTASAVAQALHFAKDPPGRSRSRPPRGDRSRPAHPHLDLISIDGEATAMRTPLHCRIRRRGLRIVRPVAAS